MLSSFARIDPTKDKNFINAFYLARVSGFPRVFGLECEGERAFIRLGRLAQIIIETIRHYEQHSRVRINYSGSRGLYRITRNVASI